MLEPVCSASWEEQMVEQSLPPGSQGRTGKKKLGFQCPFRAYHVLPPGSQQVKDRQEGAGVPVPFQGTPCLISFPVAEIADRPS